MNTGLETDEWINGKQDTRLQKWLPGDKSKNLKKMAETFPKWPVVAVKFLNGELSLIIFFRKIYLVEV